MDEKDIREIKDRLDLVNSNLAAILGFFRELEELQEVEEDEQEEDD